MVSLSYTSVKTSKYVYFMSDFMCFFSVNLIQPLKEMKF